jgi:hypothetical protein
MRLHPFFIPEISKNFKGGINSAQVSLGNSPRRARFIKS